jgi:hypothetical protein
LRIASLGDYLVSVSKSVVVDQPAAAIAVKSAARSRFVPLLIVNDVLHTDKYHQRRAGSGIFGKESMSYIPELIELAAAYISQKESQAEKKLRAILNYWATNQLVSADDVKSLRDRTDEALLIAQGGTPIRKRHYLLPEYHGDRNAPWYDLPASYMLEQMIKHPNRPIDSSRIKIAKLDKKPVTTHVRKLLDNYFENIDLKYVPTGDNPSGETKKYKLWLDPMGQLVKQDKETGDTNTVSNGYGWSMKLCQDMQKDGVPENIRIAREDAQREEEMEQMQPAPQQRKDDLRYSASPRRPRSSSSDSEYRRGRGRRSHSRNSSRSSYDGRQDSRSKGRTQSRSRRQTPPRPEHRNSHDRGRHYGNGERDQQRPPSRPYGRNGPDGPSRNQGISNNSQYPVPPQNFAQGFPQPPPLPFSAPPFPPQPHMPNQFPGQLPMQPFPPPPPFQSGAFPGGIPPPPPPNYSGPFPPPLPNMPAMPHNPYNFGGNQSGNNAYGNNAGYGQNSGHGQNQGNFQGNFQGGRGGHRGNYQGGGYNGRGGYGGQRGGRW